MYRQPWDLAQVRKSAGYDHKHKSNYSLNCQKSRFSARLRIRGHIFWQILTKLFSCMIAQKISHKFDNGQDMIISSRVIAPWTAKLADFQHVYVIEATFFYQSYLNFSVV